MPALAAPRRPFASAALFAVTVAATHRNTVPPIGAISQRFYEHRGGSLPTFVRLVTTPHAASRERRTFRPLCPWVGWHEPLAAARWDSRGETYRLPSEVPWACTTESPQTPVQSHKGIDDAASRDEQSEPSQDGGCRSLRQPRTARPLRRAEADRPPSHCGAEYRGLRRFFFVWAKRASKRRRDFLRELEPAPRNHLGRRAPVQPPVSFAASRRRRAIHARTSGAPYYGAPSPREPRGRDEALMTFQMRSCRALCVVDSRPSALTREAR
jgi:hypothetical protein